LQKLALALQMDSAILIHVLPMFVFLLAIHSAVIVNLQLTVDQEFVLEINAFQVVEELVV